MSVRAREGARTRGTRGHNLVPVDYCRRLFGSLDLSERAREARTVHSVRSLSSRMVKGSGIRSCIVALWVRRHKGVGWRRGESEGVGA